MQPLTTHLRDVDRHDRLAFHPACPICRQSRLTGHLDDAAILSPRTRALVAAGVLAVASATPPVGVAAEPDHQQEGTAAVAGGQPVDPTTGRDFNPGGQATRLPDAAGPPTAGEPVDAVATPPATHDDDPVVDPGDGTDSPTDARGAPPPGPPPASSAPPPPPASADLAAPAPDGPASDAAPAGSAPSAAVHEPPARPPRASRVDAGAGALARTRPSVHRPVASIVVVPRRSLERVVVTADTSPPSVDGRRARPGDRWHTVLAGESLWSIASDALGGDATIARVAREVHELWKLNRERIGTGDPDLIMIGTVLRLR